jgi:hypothetical protein
LSAIKVVQAKEKGFIYDLQTKPFSLFDKRDFFSALLDRRGGGIKLRKSTTPASVSSPLLRSV